MEFKYKRDQKEERYSYKHNWSGSWDFVKKVSMGKTLPEVWLHSTVSFMAVRKRSSFFPFASLCGSKDPFTVVLLWLYFKPLAYNILNSCTPSQASFLPSDTHLQLPLIIRATGQMLIRIKQGSIWRSSINLDALHEILTIRAEMSCIFTVIPGAMSVFCLLVYQHLAKICSEGKREEVASPNASFEELLSWIVLSHLPLS